MQFLVPSPVARGGVSEAFISFRVNHIYRSLTVIDANGCFSFCRLTRLNRSTSTDCVQLLGTTFQMLYVVKAQRHASNDKWVILKVDNK